MNVKQTKSAFMQRTYLTNILNFIRLIRWNKKQCRQHSKRKSASPYFPNSSRTSITNATAKKTPSTTTTKIKKVLFRNKRLQQMSKRFWCNQLTWACCGPFSIRHAAFPTSTTFASRHSPSWPHVTNVVRFSGVTASPYKFKRKTKYVTINVNCVLS